MSQKCVDGGAFAGRRWVTARHSGRRISAGDLVTASPTELPQAWVGARQHYPRVPELTALTRALGAP